MAPENTNERFMRQTPEQLSAELEARADELTKLSRAIAVLQTLRATGKHFNQKLTMNGLWRRINGSLSKSEAIPSQQLETLKKVCRQLHAIDLVTARGEKMGTGGVKTNSATSSKRRQSATRQVFKVGIESQERKKEIQALLEYSQVEELLAQRFAGVLGQ